MRAWISIGILVLVHVTVAEAQIYSVTDLGQLPGDSQAEGNGINAAGYVVGFSSNHAVRWDATSHLPADLGAIPSFPPLAYGAEAISGPGYVAGFGGSLTYPSAFIWLAAPALGLPAGMTYLGSLPGGGSYSLAQGINDAGQVAGWSDTNFGNHAFIWDPVTHALSDLGTLVGPSRSSLAYDINNSGQVVGASNSSLGDHAFIWLPAPAYGLPAGMNDLGVLPGGTDISYAYGMNDNGYAVGVTGGSPVHGAFIWSPVTHVMTIIDDLPGGGPGTEAAVRDLNNNQYVVGSGHGLTGIHALLWTPTGGSIDLNDHLDGSGAGWVLYEARSINDSGCITGAGRNPAGEFDAFLLCPMEPTPVMLASFQASFQDGHVLLEWTTSIDVGPEWFQVDRRERDSNWQLLTEAPIRGTEHRYVYNDDAVEPGVAYEYQLVTGDSSSGDRRNYGPVSIRIPIGGGLALRPYPNPTVGESRISFTLPRAGGVRLSIHDVLGREVITLSKGIVGAGTHEVSWAGVDASGRPVASGAYFLRLDTIHGSKVIPLTVLR